MSPGRWSGVAFVLAALLFIVLVGYGWLGVDRCHGPHGTDEQCLAMQRAGYFALVGATALSFFAGIALAIIAIVRGLSAPRET